MWKTQIFSRILVSVRKRWQGEAEENLQTLTQIKTIEWTSQLEKYARSWSTDFNTTIGRKRIGHFSWRVPLCGVRSGGAPLKSSLFHGTTIYGFCAKIRWRLWQCWTINFSAKTDWFEYLQASNTCLLSTTVLSHLPSPQISLLTVAPVPLRSQGILHNYCRINQGPFPNRFTVVLVLSYQYWKTVTIRYNHYLRLLLSHHIMTILWSQTRANPVRKFQKVTRLKVKINNNSPYKKKPTWKIHKTKLCETSTFKTGSLSLRQCLFSSQTPQPEW